MTELVTIGKITTNQGNRGEVKVMPLTDFPERFELMETVFVEIENGLQEMEIENVRFHKGQVVIKFAGLDNIEQALALQNNYLQIEAKDLLPLQDDDYYIFTLKGFQVEDEKGDKLGRLKDVLTTGGTDVFFVEGDSKECMIPASKEFIKNIDLEKEIITVKLIPGLLEL